MSTNICLLYLKDKTTFYTTLILLVLRVSHIKKKGVHVYQRFIMKYKDSTLQGLATHWYKQTVFWGDVNWI